MTLGCGDLRGCSKTVCEDGVAPVSVQPLVFVDAESNLGIA